MWIKQRDRHGCGTIFRQDLNKFSGADMNSDVTGGDLYEPKARQATSNMGFCMLTVTRPLIVSVMVTPSSTHSHRREPAAGSGVDFHTVLTHRWSAPETGPGHRRVSEGDF